MKAIFIYDTRVKEEENKLLTTGTINNDVMNRYFKYCSQIKILSRKETRKNKRYRTVISNENVIFREIPNIISRRHIKNKIKAKEILTEEIRNADFIVIRLPSYNGNLAVNICNYLKKRFIVEFVGCPFDSIKKEFYGLGYILATFNKYNTKKIIKKCDSVIYVTNEFLQKRYPNNGKSIGCSDVIIGELLKVNLQNRLELTSTIKGYKQIKLGIIGNYYKKYKGIDVGIKAIRELSNRGFDATLNILGEGDKEPYIRLAQKLNIEDKINFCGVLSSGNEVLEWLDRIQIYIQPSYQEGMPRALIEAMSRGCPAVTSNVGGMPEVIDREFVHKPGDYKELAKKIEYIIINSNVAVEQVMKNFEKSKEFTKDVLDSKRDKFIKDYLNVL